MSDFERQWNAHIRGIEEGWMRARRSSRVSLLPELSHMDDSPRYLHLKFEAAPRRHAVRLALWTPDDGDFNPTQLGGGWEKQHEPVLELDNPSAVYFDGLCLLPANTGHSATLEKRRDAFDFRYKITLAIESATLSPVLAESSLLRSAQSNMTATEVDEESHYFSATCGPDVIVIAGPEALASLEITCEGAQPGRDTVWFAKLRVQERYARTAASPASVQVNHTPFVVAQMLQPVIVPEAGTILAQWRSDDKGGARWRFGVETVELRLPPQAVGEVMVRGLRFRPANAPSPINEKRPIAYRFSRRTELVVKPSRLVQRYTVHPADLLSVLYDAELERMVTELAYPLEVIYERTPHSRRTVIVSEVGKALGQPVMALPLDEPESAFSGLLAAYYLQSKFKLDEIVHAQRIRHLAARASFRYRVAQFPLADAKEPRQKLDLREGLTARLRSRKEGTALVYPFADGVMPAPEQLAGMDDFVAPDASSARLPAGLLYSVEFASELSAILRTPATSDVQLIDLTLSVLGATGAMQAAFDEGRTVFDVKVENGQLSRLVKTRYGRIAAVWNKARHVVIYERSTAPGAQFQDEQKHEWFPGRPLLRKMEEYVEILEPRRLFGAESSASQNRTGCLHAFHFATRTIHVNSAWGRDVKSGYEIPLYNELDTTGFYIKPWMGPLARGGGDELAQHWHRKPQHLYFYSNTEPGKGADSDLWDAHLHIDLSDDAGLGSIASSPDRISGEDLIDQRWVPSYTLEAASNPRFAMEVEAEGAANLMHGRGSEELVATVRTMHIERTMATSRVDLGLGSPLASKVAQPVAELWKVAKGSAELKSIDATIGSILTDARTLWKTFGSGGNCDNLKKELVARVDAAFAESEARLKTTLAMLPATQAEQEGTIAEGFKLAQRLPDAVIDCACVQAERAIADLRVWLAKLTNGAGTIEQRWSQIEATYLVLPVRALLQRASSALHGPIALIDRIGAEIVRLINRLDGEQELFVQTLDGIKASVAALLASVPASDIQQQAIALIDKASAAVEAQLSRLDSLSTQMDKLTLPLQVQGLQQWRQQAIALLVAPAKLGRVALNVLAEARKKVEAIDPAEPDAIKTGLRDGMAAAIDTIASEVGIYVSAVTNWLGKPRAELALMKNALQDQQTMLRNGVLSAEIEHAFEAELQAYKALKAAVEAPVADLTVQVAAFDSALEAVHLLVERPVLERRAVLAIAASDQLGSYTWTIEERVAAMATFLSSINEEVSRRLEAVQAGVPAELTRRKQEVLNVIGELDCTAWDDFAKKLEDKVGEVVGQLRDEVTAQAARLFDQKTIACATEVSHVVKQIISDPNTAGDALLKKICDDVEPKAGQAIKLTRLLSDPPQLPQLTIRTDSLECVFDDLKDQIDTSPFVARLRDLDAGIKELGLAVPSRSLLKNIMPDPLQGMDFSKVIRNAALDFENFFKRFKLPQMPDGAIRVSHHIDSKKRSAHVKAEINHQFGSTESLFDVMSLSMDIRKPKLEASTNFDVSPSDPGKSSTWALFSGDWVLNFAGQPLVTFVGATVQYSDRGGFKFDLDPTKIEPHAALKFIGDVIRAQMPKLPESVEIIKNSEGMPIGASIRQQHAFGPLELGGVSIGETVLASGFGLRIVDGKMKLDASFGIGSPTAPVFLQIGLYGGGGWLTARAFVDYRDGEMLPGYAASVGVSLGTAKAFTLAGVAHGNYALRLFIEASFSENANSFIAGLQLTGSARVLGYLSAYLNLLVQVEHGGGQMHGRGQLDISVKVCWCYTARVSRTVQQNM